MAYSAKELAELTGATLHGNPEKSITSVADLQSATDADASFLSNRKYTNLVGDSGAGLICVDSTFERLEHQTYLVSDSPSRTFQQIATTLLKEREQSGFSGIHETAVIHPTARIADGVTIGPYAVIDALVEIDSGTTVGPHVYIGAGSTLGKDCHLHPHAVLREHCQLGNRVILQPGAIIGSCGFGYDTDKAGTHTKLEQLGNVLIEDDVEIGANTTIDRARFMTTKIGSGTKIDNLVQIAHNVELGEHNILCAQTGLAGSTKTGRNVMMGGQVGVVGHLEICPFTMIATRGGVSKSITQSGKYAGSPILPLAEYNKMKVHTRKIASLFKQVQDLAKELKDLKNGAAVHITS